MWVAHSRWRSIECGGSIQCSIRTGYGKERQQKQRGQIRVGSSKISLGACCIYPAQSVYSHYRSYIPVSRAKHLSSTTAPQRPSPPDSSPRLVVCPKLLSPVILCNRLPSEIYHTHRTGVEQHCQERSIDLPIRSLKSARLRYSILPIRME